MKTHLRALESRSEEHHLIRKEDDIAKPLDVFSVLEEVAGECVKTPNLPDSYLLSCGTLQPADKSILTDFNNGRLGNQLTSLASVVAMARLTGLQPVISHRCYSAITAIFEDLSLPVLEGTFCSACSQLHFQRLLDPTPQAHGAAFRLPVAYANLIPLYAPLLPEIRSMLTFKSRFKDLAQERLKTAAKQSSLSSPVSYVGVHNRRGDYAQHIKGYGADLNGPDYFNGALQLMRKVLTNPVFVVVTDDPGWARKHITGKDVFHLTEESRVDGVGVDLAVLAACNHTIITYGTFGLWGAMLSGGLTIMSTRASVLRPLITQAGLNTFVFMEEGEDVSIYEEGARRVMERLT